MSHIKNEIIRAFATAANEKELEDTEVILYTSSGIIYGKMVMDGVELPQTDHQKNVSSFYVGLLNAVHNNVNDGQLNDCEAYVYLTNATVKPSLGTPIPVGNIVVFCDQIVGISIGTIESRKPDPKIFG